jgi:type II secretory pathway pseudopilin PulG
MRWVVIGLLGLLLSGIAMSLIRIGGTAAAKAQAASARARCLNNLQRLAKALNQYAEDHGKYPAPYSVSERGVPLLSWRVHLLPYLGHKELYQKFNLSLPWDDPYNLKWVSQAPDVFASPGDIGNFKDTSYMLITGTGTLFPPAGPLSPSEIPDGTAKTLLVVETGRPTGNPVPWSRPIDLDISTMNFTIGGNPGVEIGGNHKNGATVATADGRPHFLRDTIPGTLIRALITPAGREAIRDDALD